MNEETQQTSLARGRDLLAKAAAVYERQLSAEEYWWLGAGLAACTLAELGGKEYALGRIEQLMDRLGYKGVQGDWFQRFLEELAPLDAEGLLWPLYERSPEGPMTPTGLRVHPSFDADAAYYLSLAHLAVAVALTREDSESIARLADLIHQMVEHGLKPEQATEIMAALADEEAEQP